MKYIDAEKLIAEIEKRLSIFEHGIAYDCWESCKKIVESLQQEQPEVDLVAELEHHLATTPNEQLEKEWKELEPWNNIGPTVQEFLYGKQPEVDLNEEIDRFLKSEESTTYENAGSYKVAVKDLKKIARHFYELGLNARKEENK